MTLTLLGISSLVANTFVLPRLRARLTDHMIATGSLFLASGLLLMLSALRSEAFLYVLVIGQVTVGFASLNALLSSMTSSDRQGELQGALGVIESCTTVAAPFVYPWLFMAGLNFSPSFAGAPFLISAVLTMVAALALMQSCTRNGSLGEKSPLEPGRN